ncbi:hypothetical protein CPB84DRAFT_1771269 [Gymnopilus junonius]|uniref:Uncharacterized protein n=1 Tax=Gymnopilus junonius TaxID=109634 RepID=A0A9P5NUP2_GYMJU|nr:hypothetical protein CPB84DRAFT_1771269 [Gymnopilus junonius]
MSQPIPVVQFSIGEKVKLNHKIQGSSENPFVYGGDPTQESNRTKSEMSKDTEVVIKLDQARFLPRSSTGGAGMTEDPQKDYSCQKSMGAKYRVVKDLDGLTDDLRYRVPHTHLSRTEGGGRDEFKTFRNGQYAHVIKEWSWTTRSEGKQSLKVNDVIKISGQALSQRMGTALQESTVHVNSAAYAFYRTDTKEKRPIYWKSDEFHPPSAYKKT